MKKLMIIGIAVTAFAASARTVAYWTFGDKGLTDVTGNGNMLEADANVTIGETAAMNGAQKLFSTVNALNLSGYTAVTVEFWTKFNAAENGTVMLLELSEDRNQCNGAFYLTYGEATGAVLGMYTSGGGNSGAEESPVIGIGDGQWHHIAFVTSPSTMSEACSKLYIDKTHVYTHCYKYAANFYGWTDYPSNKKLYIGSRANSSLQFKGEIDNLRVSNMALTPDEFVNLDGSVPTPKPIAYWPFGSAGGTDMSGNGHDLHLGATGVSLTNGALGFDGSQADTFTRLPINLRECSKGLTTEFWFRAPAGRTDAQMLLELSPLSGASCPGSSAFYCNINEGTTKMACTMRCEDGYHMDVHKETEVQDGAWHHVAYVYDPSVKGVDRCRFYLDGVQQAQTSGYRATNIVAIAKEHLYFGGRHGKQFTLTGEIDDVRLVPSALNPEQFMSARTTENAEVSGHWTFNRGAETTNARGTATLVATGVTYENGAAVLDGSGTLSTSTLTLEGAATVECFFATDNTWHHLVKIYGDGINADPTSVLVDGVAGESELLTFASGALQIAKAGFTGRIDDVRVTAGALASSSVLAARTDDTPVELAHWSFDKMVDYGIDSVGCNPLSEVSETGLDKMIADRAIVIAHSAGLRTRRPLHLAHWPAFTVEWFGRTTQTTPGNFLELGTNFNNQIGHFCTSTSFMSDGSPGAGFRTSTGHNIRTTAKGASKSDGAWHHYAYVVDRSSGTLQTAFYVDGEPQSNWSAIYSSTANTAFVDDYLMVGARYTRSASYDGYASYVGDLDEIRIVNGALTPSQMMTMADRTAQENTTVAHWRFDGETPLADLSGNGYDLTGTAQISDGAAVFTGSTSLQTTKPLAISGYRQLTVETVFQTDAPEETGILFETGLDYASTSGSLSCYYNGAGNFYGRIDACTRGLAWTSDTTRLRDSRWHHVAMEVDFDIKDNTRIRYFIDGVLAGAWPRAEEKAKIAADTTLADLILYLGARAGTTFFMKGRMKEARVTAGLVAPAKFLERPAPEVDAKNVVAYWPFTRSADWTMDETGHGYELSTAGKGVSQANGCVSFEANHDALETSTRIDFTKMEKFTVEAFVRPKAYANKGIMGTCTWDAGRTSHASGILFATGTNAVDNVDLACGVTLDAFRNYAPAWIAVTFNSSPKTFDAKDRWHHIALVVDRTAGTKGNVSYYYDRKLVSSENVSVQPTFPAVQFAVGSLVGDIASARFVGDIDDVRITAAALTPSEMLSRRSSGFGMAIMVR